MSRLVVKDLGAIGTIVKSWMSGDAPQISGSSFEICSGVKGWLVSDSEARPLSHHTTIATRTMPNPATRRFTLALQCRTQEPMPVRVPKPLIAVGFAPFQI